MAAPPSLPAAMRAVVYSGTGKHHMTMRDAVPVPAPGPKQVLVRVHAAGINPVDYKLPTLPIVGWLLRGKGVGLDFSGVVERCGSDAGDLRAGDRVYGNCSGALAQYAVADASAVAKLPPSISHADAASLPTVALTGMQCLLEHGFRPGDRVLIPGASGGTGAAGVQIAKALGASHVTGVCSGANAELVRSLGADAVLDYTKGEKVLAEELAAHAPFDIAYDTVTSPEDTNYEPLARKVLKRGGMHVAINGGGADWTRALLSAATGMNLQRRDYALVLKHPDAAQMAQVASWVTEGKLKPLVDTRFPFTEEAVHAAFDKLKGRRTKGKLVVDIVPPEKQ
jgi:NADPH:quinone reductase-like Zn-dependent oxidoreductase